MSKNVDKQRWARLRFAIVGPLLASPPAPGELQQALRALSQRHWCLYHRELVLHHQESPGSGGSAESTTSLRCWQFAGILSPRGGTDPCPVQTTSGLVGSIAS